MITRYFGVTEPSKPRRNLGAPRSENASAAQADMSDRRLEWTIAYYPLALRRRVGNCVAEVHRLADEGGRDPDATALLKVYREARGSAMHPTLPVSLTLWVALDRLDHAWADWHAFDPRDYLSPAMADGLGLDLRRSAKSNATKATLKDTVGKKSTKRKVSAAVAGLWLESGRQKGSP